MFPLWAKHGMEPLVGHFGAKAIEGPANSVILLRANSEEASEHVPSGGVSVCESERAVQFVAVGSERTNTTESASPRRRSRSSRS